MLYESLQNMEIVAIFNENFPNTVCFEPIEDTKRFVSKQGNSSARRASRHTISEISLLLLRLGHLQRPDLLYLLIWTQDNLDVSHTSRGKWIPHANQIIRSCDESVWANDTILRWGYSLASWYFFSGALLVTTNLWEHFHECCILISKIYDQVFACINHLDLTVLEKNRKK